jgi:hypothetical protein
VTPGKPVIERGAASLVGNAGLLAWALPLKENETSSIASQRKNLVFMVFSLKDQQHLARSPAAGSILLRDALG